MTIDFIDQSHNKSQKVREPSKESE